MQSVNSLCTFPVLRVKEWVDPKSSPGIMMMASRSVYGVKGSGTWLDTL